ncbi:hypothetical protein K9B32_20920 [Rhizobium sp. 3T7]|nr:hypothetical protein [Rhizobium sp. 3T7]MBZ9792547.1 hypothetical protein [Rhizobium sp. 3T7]
MDTAPRAMRARWDASPSIWKQTGATKGHKIGFMNTINEYAWQAGLSLE